jgi:hypothetical protein
MIANPGILALGDQPLYALFAMARIGVGLALISHALIGKSAGPVRIVMAAAGGALIFGRVITGI